MKEETLQLDLELLLPDIPHARDECLNRLKPMLQDRRGILNVHAVPDVDPPQLCLHFDPNLISLSAVKRVAQQAGGTFSRRYRHEAIPFSGMVSADAADTLADLLRGLPGMLHVSVNYAAGVAFVAYDTQKLLHAQIEAQLHHFGYKTPAAPHDHTAEDHAGHDHGRFVALLPEWLHDRLNLLLVALAGLFLLIGWVGETFLNLPAAAAIVFYLLAYLCGGYDVATHAIPGLLKGKFDTDVLMLAAALGAALLGEWAEGAFLLFLFSLGHAGEHYALDRARHAINALGELMPSTAQVKVDHDIVARPVEAVMIGDVVVVRPGDRIPVDGQIARGTSAIDQSAITGESMPVTKTIGDEVFAGTINQENALEITVTRLAQDNTLSRVVQMVAEAQEQQSPTQQLTQRFTTIFVPAMLLLVALVIVVPPLLGWMTWQNSFYRAMLLLVAASPCALAIGTPATVLSGIAQAARNGILIKGGVHLENLGRLKVMAFDKTGTLTKGAFEVTDIIPWSENGNVIPAAELLRLTAAVEKQSNHPLALAVVKAADEKGLDLPPAEGLENVTGRGVKSRVNGQPVAIGSLKLFQETAGQTIDPALQQLVDRLESEGKTTMTVAQNGRFLGVLALSDTPRPQVRKTLQALRDLGMEKLVMLTGDNEAVAQQIGAAVGVTDVRAELMPQQKLAAIQALQDAYGPIAMAGDGVNDAPALAAATVGIAMGGAGTAVALETADVALMGDDLSKLPFAVGLSRQSRKLIQQNLAIALSVIGLLILTSVLGWVQLSGAVLLHEGSTIVVVLNALRLLRYRP